MISLSLCLERSVGPVVLLGLFHDEQGVAELRKYVEQAPSGPVR
jgi:hypothetical protein